MAEVGPQCPVARAAAIVGSKWTLLIIRDLSAGSRRFTELERSLEGISPKTLSERLRVLEHQGIVRRTAYAPAPTRVEYSLTGMGRGLIPVVESLRSYGEKYLSIPDNAV